MNAFLEVNLATIVSDNMLQDVRKVLAGVYGFEWVAGGSREGYVRWVMQARDGPWQWTLATTSAAPPSAPSCASALPNHVPKKSGSTQLEPSSI